MYVYGNQNKSNSTVNTEVTIIRWIPTPPQMDNHVAVCLLNGGCLLAHLPDELHALILCPGCYSVNLFWSVVVENNLLQL